MTATPDARQRSTRLPRPARRRQLLGAAQKVFVSQGYHAAAMDEIAERAGVSTPVLYQHFPSKLDLYLALLDQHVDVLGEQVRTALNSTRDNRERVTACIAAYFDFVDDESGAFRLVFESDLRNEPAVRERVDRSLQISIDGQPTRIGEEQDVQVYRFSFAVVPTPGRQSRIQFSFGQNQHIVRHWGKGS